MTGRRHRRVERILVVTAHPDDVDFAAAGSVAVWTAAGVEVAYCIATDGDAGGSDRSMSRADMAAIRRTSRPPRPPRWGSPT
jgi:LmbE family N-acetylglucosaminyl deacetylase